MILFQSGLTYCSIFYWFREADFRLLSAETRTRDRGLEPTVISTGRKAGIGVYLPIDLPKLSKSNRPRKGLLPRGSKDPRETSRNSIALLSKRSVILPF
ncbi:hypothetical protein [Natronobacterium texcoconense]|uniref:hypothetical protein n=1 Tax=Natronobacterium texcoconense TaxID=1095778 RepID=UPI0011139B49|nr:hypothetical protein [Natronobacterium texcoconense]